MFRDVWLLLLLIFVLQMTNKPFSLITTVQDLQNYSIKSVSPIYLIKISAVSLADDLDYNFLFPPHSPRISTGLALLLELLESTDAKHQRDSSMALCRLANKASSLSSIDAAPPSPIPQVTMLFCVIVVISANQLIQWITIVIKQLFWTKQEMGFIMIQ